jgi:hypothetical protein
MYYHSSQHLHVTDPPIRPFRGSMDVIHQAIQTVSYAHLTVSLEGYFPDESMDAPAVSIKPKLRLSSRIFSFVAQLETLGHTVFDRRSHRSDRFLYSCIL